MKWDFSDSNWFFQLKIHEMVIEIKMKMIPIIPFSIDARGMSYIIVSIFKSIFTLNNLMAINFLYKYVTVAVIRIYVLSTMVIEPVIEKLFIYFFRMPTLLFSNHFMCVHHLC